MSWGSLSPVFLRSARTRGGFVAYLTLFALICAVVALEIAIGPRPQIVTLQVAAAVVGALLLVRARLLFRERSRLLEARERFFDLSLDLHCVATFDGYFTEVNRAFERVLGWSRDELLARPFIDFAHPDDAEATYAELERLGNGRDTLHFQNRYRCADGSYRWLTWKATPSVAHAVIYATARDDTAAKLAEERLQRMNEELDAFAYTASHDLKAPLVSIEGLAASLDRRVGAGLAPRDRHYLNRIRANAAVLQELIGSMLEYARAGIDDVATFDAGPAVDAVVSRLVGLADERRARVEVRRPLPMVRAHPGRFSQAIANLVENAIHHGGNVRPPRVTIRGAVAGDFAEIGVENDGEAVPVELRASMYDMFKSGASAGSGVGLALVKRIAEASGGGVRYEALPSGGSRFVVAFPKGGTE